jgi:3D-(3,5/4)-trihydroxycyclohexane-1,2-dione acylhydrolase (decyclizing)
VQAEAFDVPAGFFEPVVHSRPRPRADRGQLAQAVDALRSAEKPLIVAGGGVHHSGATSELAAFAAAHGIPVVETMAGRASLRWGHHCYAGPIGVTGSDNANRLAAEADVVLAVGTRLADFTTGSWSVFAHDGVRLIGLNAARFDAGKHHALPLVGDARETLVELDVRLSSWTAPSSWLETAGREVAGFLTAREIRTRPPEAAALPTYAQVVGAVNRTAVPGDYVVAAAGGLPGELNGNWATLDVGDFDCEYGYSCMGYEISGAWGARMARPDGEVFAFVGDGSYLMMNSDLYSSVLSGHKLTVVLCDNGGYAVIDRLQRAQGGASFNNQLDDCRTVEPARVDFVAHARSLGCDAVGVTTIAELEEALGRARAAARTTVIVIATDPDAWTQGGAFWEVGVPEVSETEAVRTAREAMDGAKLAQRTGW